MAREAVIDFEATRLDADWRSRVWWPVSMAEVSFIGEGQVRRALGFAAACDDTLARDAVLLALPTILGYARAVVAAAVATGRAQAQGRRFVGMAPEFAYLATGEGEVPVRAKPILAAVQANFLLARRLARLATWTPARKLPKAFLAPDAVAVNHNELLIAGARQSGKAIGFRHAQAFLDQARQQGRAGPGTGGLENLLAAAVLGQDVTEEPYRTRALNILTALCRAHLDGAFRDMQALRGAHLPEEIWSGSGGLYAARAVGLEALRRGGRVVRFNHGAPMSFIEAREIDALLEMAVSSDVYLATEGAAQLWRTYRDESLYAWRGKVDIHGLVGDPVFARVPARRRLPAGRNLRVVYAPTQLLGFRQLLPAQPPDVIYLDWQMQVAEALRELSVEFICQPHPEGLLQHQAHPLETIATTIRGNFGAQIAQADVFVFDYAMTTTLWEVACTDARIVFLNIGCGRLTPEVAALFAKRARRIDVAYDEAGRPVLDRSMLADAVLSNYGAIDPMPLRRLLAGAH
jgi:hypothetical protein